MAKTSSPMAVSDKTDWQWEVEGAADALMRAEEINSNPKLLKAARLELAKRGKMIDKEMAKQKDLANRAWNRIKNRNS